MSDLAIVDTKPLPPQRWGLLPTRQFWARAWLTPIALVYWLGYIGFFSLAESLQSNWWQTALGVCIFHALWGGLVERLCRRRLARRAANLLEATAAAPAFPMTGLPSRRDAPEFSVDDWEAFVARIFGRGADAVQTLAAVGLCLLFFYPGWPGKLVAVAAMLASTWIARTCLRRWRRDALHGPRPAIDPPRVECRARH